MAHVYSWGETPQAVIEQVARERYPEGFPMRITCRLEWKALAAAWNQGIDSHLEAITSRSRADADTGEVLVHPAELGVLLRRLHELDLNDKGDEDARDQADTTGSAAGCLRGAILTHFDIEEI